VDDKTAASGRLLDLALIGGLVCTAAGAVAFAGYETLINDHMPKVNGLQYLAIFAQPSSRASDGEPALDMAPVGAVSRATPGTTAGYSLTGAQPSLAWLREGDRFFAVTPGDDVPRLGRVAAIEPRDGRWALIGERGEILIAGAEVEIADPAGGRFDKRMIFRNAR
jgi:hypothetical protein